MYRKLGMLLTWGMLYCSLSTAQFAHALPISLGAKSKDRLSIDLTLTSTFEYHTYNPEALRSAHAFKYFDLQNRLNLNITYNQYSAGVRVDTFNFFDDAVPCPKSFPECKARYLPEKIYLKVRMGAFDFVAGDYYLTVGRGIALSIRKVDEFGIDTSLRGGRMTFQKKGFRATVAAGFTNINNMDPVRETFMEDPNQLIVATELSQNFAHLFKLSGHYVYANLQGQPDETSRTLLSHTHVVGGSVHIPSLFKRVDFFFEGNALFDTNGPIQDKGYAFYSSMNIYLFPVTIQIEGQWYNRLNLPADVGSRYPTIASAPLPYINPPSLERNDLDTQGENSNAKGFRVRIDYTFPSRTTFFHINYLFRYGFLPPSVQGDALHIHNVFAGGEHRFKHVHLKYSGGIRDLTGFEIWRILHFDLDANVHFFKQHSIEFVGRYWWNVKKHEGSPDQKYHILDTQLAYAWAKWLTISFLFSYSDEFLPPIYRQVYIAGEIKLRMWQYGHIKFLGGRTRGGLRCVSGVCRIFPPFEGFKTELVFRL